MKQPPAGAVMDHLTRRTRLSTTEEKWLDRDGDGRLTSRDLLLAHSGAKPALMPALVPKTRHLRPGESLQCLVLGRCPEGLRATCAIGGRPVTLKVTTRRDRRRWWIDVELPADIPPDDRRESLVVWVMAPGTIPRSVPITINASRESQDHK